MDRIDYATNSLTGAGIANFMGETMINVSLRSPVTQVPIEWVAMPSPKANRPWTPRPGGKAKMLDDTEFNRVLRYIERRRVSREADRLKVYLSFGAGLRSCEISGLRLGDVINADGSTADIIQVRAGATKGGRGREIPMHPDVKRAVDDFRLKYPRAEWLAVSDRYGTGYAKHQDANAVSVWFHWLYRQCGLEHCSSHSGRRTFITKLARNLGPSTSLRDVQRLAGHVRLDTTETYIECSPDVVDLVNSIGLASEPSEGARNA